MPEPVQNGTEKQEPLAETLRRRDEELLRLKAQMDKVCIYNAGLHQLN